MIHTSIVINGTEIAQLWVQNVGCHNQQGHARYNFGYRQLADHPLVPSYAIESHCHCPEGLPVSHLMERIWSEITLHDADQAMRKAGCARP